MGDGGGEESEAQRGLRVSKLIGACVRVSEQVSERVSL